MNVHCAGETVVCQRIDKLPRRLVECKSHDGGLIRKLASPEESIERSPVIVAC